MDFKNNPPKTTSAKFKSAVEKRFYPSINALSKSANEQPIKFAIRTDATHAARSVISYLTTQVDPERADEVVNAVKAAYGTWGGDALHIFANYINHSQYGLSEPKGIDVEFHDPKFLSDAVIKKAKEITNEYKQPALYISLDDMIPLSDDVQAQIAFSRLFDAQTGKEIDYVQRPEHASLEEQLGVIFKTVQKMHRSAKTAARYNSAANNSTESDDVRVPVVFLEDNVRRAKMLNWIIGQMNKANIFKHARIVGISTCFCNAVEHERTGVIFEDTVVPVVPIVDYGFGAAIDVTTTRDLMFDGFVINVDDDLGRLPGIFMDVEERFKIHPNHKQDFCRDVAVINHSFCDTIEKQFGVKLPISCFESGTAIAKTQNIPLDTPMKDVMSEIIANTPDHRVTQMVAKAQRNTPTPKAQ